MFRAALAVPVAWASGLSFGQDAAAPAGAANTAAGPGQGVAGTSSLPDSIEYVPRCEWSGSRQPKPSRMRAANGFRRLTVHHWGMDVAGMNTEKNAMVRRMDGLLCSHLSRDYGDIGYHFVLDPAGRVWQGRPLEFEGAHVSGENEHNLGLMLLGNFQKERPTDAQLQALERMIRWAAALNSIDPSRFFGHCDLASSECPGRLLYPSVKTIREASPA